jgi:hypothetical protein
MPQPATTETSPTFAGILAAVALPEQKRPPARDLDGLDDDVATFSYERALRAHSRFRKPDPPDHIDHLKNLALTQPAPSEPIRIHEVFPAELEPAIEPEPAPQPSAGTGDPPPEAVRDNATAHGRDLKSASITIRLSKGECAQLRQRAAEAGLTISAYLRSCTVEADLLRAQVKDTMAQMRAEAPKANQEAASAFGEFWFGRLRRYLLRRFWPRAQSRRHIAQA